MFRRNTPISQRFSTTPVRRRPSLDFSVTGVVYISMMLFMGLAAINSQANLLFGVFGLMIGVLLVSGIISFVVLSRQRDAMSSSLSTRLRGMRARVGDFGGRLDEGAKAEDED